MSVRLGISGFDLVYMGKSLKDLVDMATQLGVTWVEVTYPQQVTLRQASQVRDVLQSRNIKTSAVVCWSPILSGDRESRKAVYEAIQVAEVLNSEHILCFAGPYGKDVTAALNACSQHIESILEYACKKRVKVLIENECGDDLTYEAGLTLEFFQRWDSDWLGMCYDPCNFYMGTEEPYPYAFNILRKYIEYIHMKDCYRVPLGTYNKVLNSEEYGRFYDNDGGFIIEEREYKISPLGMGAINYSSLLSRLDEDEYGGFVVVHGEVRPEEYLRTVGKSLEYIEEQTRWRR